MPGLRQLSRAVVVAALLAGVAGSAPATAAAASGAVRSERLTIAAAERRFCATRAVRGAGIARRYVTAPHAGIVGVRLSGSRDGDWDLAIVDRATRRVLNGSARPGVDELATAVVGKGQALSIQVCRRSGETSRAVLRTRFVRVRAAKEPGRTRARLLRVALDDAGDAARLEALGLDTTDHPRPDHWDVIVTSDGDERRIRRAGLRYSVRVRDLAGADRANRRVEQRAAASARARAAAAAGIPSGRTTYRTLPEHEQDLKRLAEENPGLVRLISLPGRTWEGREIVGIEIAEGVGSPSDGRPVYVQVGTHHAREWPAAEATIEFGLELVQGYKRGDPRLTEIVRSARTFVIPVLNADGFDATIQAEGLSPGGSYADPNDAPTNTSAGPSGNQLFGTGAYKRKNCRPANPARPVAAGECLAQTFPVDTIKRDRGVDLNRNYGVEWGGPGTSSDPSDLTFHGPEPFSEPETAALRSWLRGLQPAVVISNHTYSGLILRPPGTSRFGPAPDEGRLQALGDAMARETAYLSVFSYQLYDTTGTSDDYLYDGLGALAYTPEIGKAEFHPAFGPGFIAEYDGRPERDSAGNPTGRRLGGLREAFTLAGLAAARPDSHAVIRGTAPAGRTLRISKTLTYRTSDRPNDDGIQNAARTITEPRSTTLVVPPPGAFSWHVNPSSQPRAGAQQPWRLTCEDASGRVFEARDVQVARAQSVDVALACGGDGSPPTGSGGDPTPPAAACRTPSGFTRVEARRRGRGALLAFRRTVRNPVTIDVFQAVAGGRRTRLRRVIRFAGRQTSVAWSGRGPRGRRLADGVYSVRFTMRDRLGRLDVQRVTIRRRDGRFVAGRALRPPSRCP